MGVVLNKVLAIASIMIGDRRDELAAYQETKVEVARYTKDILWRSSYSARLHDSFGSETYLHAQLDKTLQKVAPNVCILDTLLLQFPGECGGIGRTEKNTLHSTPRFRVSGSQKRYMQ